MVTVEFVLERDIDLAVQDVREKISADQGQNCRQTSMNRSFAKVDPDATAGLVAESGGRKSIRELSTYADEVLKEQLQRINGVGAIRLGGLRLRQVRVWLDCRQAPGLSDFPPTTL